MDLIEAVMDGIIDENTQFVVVGTGQEQYEAMFRHYQNLYPDQVSANILYSDKLARKLYAAADAFLMPSRFEPCGLTQLISFRYGTAPIVRETGGLKDTIKDFGCIGGGNGYTFTNAFVGDLEYSIRRAVADYKDKDEWQKKIKKVMSLDFSWNKTAKEYIETYNEL